MLNFLQQVRPWLEAAYFLSTLLLAGAAIFGLQQIRLMKRDMQTRSDRAAREKAIEYIARYFSEFVPLNTRFTEECITKKLIYTYAGSVGDFSYATFPRTHYAAAWKRFKIDSHSWMPALNELQTIAAAFAYGIADEKLGFQSIGRTFCHAVESMYDILSMARKELTCPYYESIILLYQLWHPRLSKSELTARRNELDKELSTLSDNSTPNLG